MRLDRRRLRVLLIVAAGVLAAALGLVLGGAGALDGAESLTVDQRFQIRGVHDIPDDLVVAGIDGVSILALDERPPFKRSVHATAVRNLTRAGAKAIVYDLQFSEPTEPFNTTADARIAAEQEDLDLLDALTASKRVVLGADEFVDGQPGIVFVDEDLALAETTIGDARFTPRSGGVYRHVPAALDGFPSLARAGV